MQGIPMELFTMLGSGLLSGVMTLWSQSMKSRQQQHEQMIEALKVQGGLVKEARKYNNAGFQWTRRIVTLLAVSAIIVLPKVVAVFWPDIGVTVGYSEWDPGFLFFEGSNKVTWHVAHGLVITPLDTQLMSAIVGLYFGSSIVKNAR